MNEQNTTNPADVEAFRDDPLEVVRCLAGVAAQRAKMDPVMLRGEPDPLGEWSPIVRASKRICVLNGYAEDGNELPGFMERAARLSLASSAATAAPGELPPLPKCKMLVGQHLDSLHVLYSADQVREIQREAYEAGRASNAGAAPAGDLLRALIDGIPLQEPVNIGKALRAHRLARAVLSGGTGPVAAVHLVNIGLTGWVYTEATAEAYAKGFNDALKYHRHALLEVAPSNNSPAGG